MIMAILYLLALTGLLDMIFMIVWSAIQKAKRPIRHTYKIKEIR